MPPQPTCLGLTSLRGIAALAVVVQHCLLVLKVAGHDDPFLLPLSLGSDSPWLLHQHFMLALFNGEAAVVLFFVLSGTVLTLSIQRDEPFNTASLVRYWIRRLFRLYPLLVASTLLAAALLILLPGHADVPNATTWASRELHTQVTASAIVKTSLGISNTLNTPVWTITIEIAASLLFPALYLIATRASTLAKVATLACLTSLSLASPFSIRHIEIFLVAFYLGPLVLLHGARPAKWVWSLRPTWRITVVMAVALVSVLAKRLISPDVWNDGSTALILAFASAAIVAVIYFGPQTGILSHPQLVRLGDISYGIYLIHLPVLMLSVRLAAPYIPVEMTPTATLAFHLALAAIVIAITVPLAALSFRFIEAPFQNFGRRLARSISVSSAPRSQSRHV